MRLAVSNLLLFLAEIVSSSLLSHVNIRGVKITILRVIILTTWEGCVVNSAPVLSVFPLQRVVMKGSAAIVSFMPQLVCVCVCVCVT